MINVLNELKKIKKYIDENYGISSEIKKSYLFKYELIIKTEKYDIQIQVDNKNPKSYIPKNFGLYLNYEANKKFKKELCYAGGGCMIKYFLGDYKAIDEYLKNFNILKSKRQMSIFDFILK